MTPAKRQKLREKHTYLGDYCGFCTKDGGYPADYPCDVIKVLDWFENAWSEGYGEGYKDGQESL